jgi:DNA uptake protein ComE-like DNA-binding protein
VQGRNHGALTAAQRRAAARPPALRWLWLLVPIGSLGMASFIPPMYFAIRQQRRSGFVWSAVLLAAITAFFIVDPHNHNDRGLRHGVAVALIMLCLVGGAAVTVGFLVAGPRAVDAVTVARRQRRLRARARKLVETDPRLALEAHIGRPDIAGDHGDGGLVDVNRVPASTLAGLPGIDAALADRIVNTRRDVGGYASLADLVTTLGLDPVHLDEVADQLVFIPLELDRS